MRTFLVWCWVLAAAAVEVEPRWLDVPLERFYGQHWQQKKNVHQLVVHDGVVHIAHGTSNTQVPQQILWYDAAADAFAVALRADGQPFTFSSEDVRWIRIIDDEVVLLDYDPINGPAQIVRGRAGGTWRVQRVSGDAHNRDIAGHDGHFFIHHGHSLAPWPQVRWSSDDGSTWHSLDQRDLYAGRDSGLGYEFFTFAGDLYTTSAGLKITNMPRDPAALRTLRVEDLVAEPSTAPWLLCYAGGTPPRFNIAVGTVAEAFPGGVLPPGLLAAYITRAVEHDGRLFLLLGGSPFVATSITPPVFAAVPVSAGERVIDHLVIAGDMHQVRYQADPGRAALWRFDDVAGWREVMGWSAPAMPTSTVVWNHTLLVAGADQRIARIALLATD